MEARFSRCFVAAGLTLLSCVAFTGCGSDSFRPVTLTATPTEVAGSPTPGPSSTATATTTPPPTATLTRPRPTATVTLATPRATATETGTPAPTGTPTLVGGALCGDGVVEGNETCDDGGTCLNGPTAGMRCPAIVEGGVNCAAPGVCRPSGGDGCAENCTVETTVDFPLGDAETSRSFQLVAADPFSIPVTVSGRITFRIGQPRADQVETAAGNVFNPGDIPVVETVLDNRWTPEQPDRGIAPFAVQPGIACACPRGFAVKSCGALLPDDPGFVDCTPRCLASDGSGQCAGGSNVLEPCTSDSDCPGGACGQICTPDLGPEQCPSEFTCTNRDGVCPDDAARCDFIHGPGNQASGVIGCGATGLTNIDYAIAADGIRTFSGGPTSPGSALISISTAFGSITGSDCSFDPTQALNGPDGLPCTDDDLDKGTLVTVPHTTGTASIPPSIIALGQGGPIICVDPPCTSVSGAPFMCSALRGMQPSTAGAALVAAYLVQSMLPPRSVPVLLELVSTAPTPLPILVSDPTPTRTPGG